MAPSTRLKDVFKVEDNDNHNVFFLKYELQETVRFFQDLSSVRDMHRDLGLDASDKKHLTRSRIFKALYRSKPVQDALKLARPMYRSHYLAPNVKPAAAESSNQDSNKRPRSD